MAFLYEVVLLQSLLLLSCVVVTQGQLTERHCDPRIFVGYENCMCGYTKQTSPGGGYQLKVINCTNQHFSEIQSIRRLRQLSSELSGSDYDELETFIFVGNTIPELPQKFVGKVSLSELYQMDLSNNQIHTILGKTFHAMPYLQKLILDNNDWYVDERSPRVFSSIFNLEVLSLNNAFTSGNHVTLLSTVFEGSKLDYLRELYLENNKLISVNAEVFQNLPSLERVSLAHNSIHILIGLWNTTCFASEYTKKYLNKEQISPLRYLDLSDNLITVVPQSFLDEIDKLNKFETLNLTGNPLRCDHHVRPLYKVLTGQKQVRYTIVDTDNFVCQTPDELKGRKVTSLKESELLEEDPTNVAAIVFGVLFGIIVLSLIVVLYIYRYYALEKAQSAWGNVKKCVKIVSGIVTGEKLQPVDV